MRAKVRSDSDEPKRALSTTESVEPNLAKDLSEIEEPMWTRS